MKMPPFKKTITLFFSFMCYCNLSLTPIFAQLLTDPAITTPTPGTTLPGETVTFNYIGNGAAVTEWWLYAGTSIGARNIYDSRSLGTTTRATVSGLPTDRSTVYLRLWYRISGSWFKKDFTYIAATEGKGPGPAITSPTPGSTLPGEAATFNYTANSTAVNQWWIYIGTSVGAKNIYDSGSLGTATRATVSGLPTGGSPVHFRLWYRAASKWFSKDFTYIAGGDPPTIDFRTHPNNSQTNLDSFIVAVKILQGDFVMINKQLVQPDSAGNVVYKVPLSIGSNIVELIVDEQDGPREIVSKVITYNPQFSTAGRRLIYVDVVEARLSGEPTGLDGTIVMDADGNMVLGFIEGKHIRGITPDGSQIFFNDKTVFNTQFHEPMVSKLNCSMEEIPSNAFSVSPLGDFVICGGEVLDLITNSVRSEKLPVTSQTGNAFGGAPISGGPAISPDSKTLIVGPIFFPHTVTSRIGRISLQDNSMDLVGKLVGPYFLSDLTVSPDNRYLMHPSYCCSNGLRIFDMQDNFTLKKNIDAGDFTGEVVFSSNGTRAIVGSAGNPRFRGGGIRVINMGSLELESTVLVDLADNLTITDNDEIFVSSGNRVGIDVFKLQEDGTPLRTKAFYLGVNRLVQSTGIPKNDEIRKIFFKPAIN